MQWVPKTSPAYSGEKGPIVTCPSLAMSSDDSGTSSQCSFSSSSGSDNTITAPSGSAS